MKVRAALNPGNWRRHGTRLIEDCANHEGRVFKDALDDVSHAIAMEILAETATQGAFTPDARSRLERRYHTEIEEVPIRIADVIGILVHDGYLSDSDVGYRFESNLLRDWWSVRLGNRRAPASGRHHRRTEK